ncbi:AraC family transcriptional regulator [Alkalihalobacterium bogoriense]|uniref:AraC family transcriptional regulator n=1 Tax=Alkalihalobacterium bogoriense TaxID=246272 RepID=UPI000A054C23|nr:AraC family transcriptional regulator [Alkalihalobacterium bogoriense]
MTHYDDRINDVMKYIEHNLSKKITLEELAEISNFSKYHFSRVFTSIVGMTPYAFLNDRRLTKSLHYLVNTDKTVLEISILCGFDSASNFNRAFKKCYGYTPSSVRQKPEIISNISLHHDNNPQEKIPPSRYANSEIKNHLLRRIWNMNITVTELPNLDIAYVRHVGSYLETGQTWRKLGEWAAKHELLPPNHSFIGISLDDPNVTDEYSCRYDACVTINDSLKKDSDSSINYRTLQGGLYALYPFYDTIDKLAIAYQTVYGQWLPTSEYEPEDKHSLEFCMNNPFEDPEGKAKIDLYIPIRKRHL